MERVPQDENVWKVVMDVAQRELTERDKLSLRVVCHASKAAADHYIRFSEKQFGELVRKMQRECAPVTDWLEIEKALEALVLANRQNPKFQKMMTDWIALMDPPDMSALVAASEDRLKRNRPGFRKGLKKMGKGAAGTVCLVGAVVTLPLALVSIPFFFSKNRGVQTGGACLAAPFGLAVTFAGEMFSSTVHERNLRDVGNYVRMRQCIARIQLLLAESPLPQTSLLPQ